MCRACCLKVLEPVWRLWVKCWTKIDFVDHPKIVCIIIEPGTCSCVVGAQTVFLVVTQGPRMCY
jgi:hypothetical protein